MISTPLQKLFLTIGLEATFYTKIQQVPVYVVESASQFGITVMPAPIVTVTEPPSVQNIAAFQDLIVRGSHFYDSDDLVCIVN